MSGPKVIRTVTIEELREAARVQLVLVDRALDRWRKEVVVQDAATGLRRDRLVQERDRIAASLGQDQFGEIAKRADTLLAAVEHDIQSLQEEQDARIARKRAKERSLPHTARSLLDRCRQTQTKLSGRDRGLLEQAATGAVVDAAEVTSLAADVLQRITEAESGKPATDRQALVQSLSGQSPAESAGDLLARLESELIDPRLAAAEKWVVELERLGETQVAARFSERLSEIVGDGATSRPAASGLALDALGMELSRTALHAREKAALRRQLSAEVAAATATSDLVACQPLVREMEDALEAGELAPARSTLERIRSMRESCHRTRAADTARSAILDGLRQLGYDVRDGMQSIWTNRKRLIVRHVERPGVALELSGDGESGRLQTRMVAVHGEVRDSRNDQQVEEAWCGDLTKLGETVGSAGGTIRIEKALAAGAIPLKLVVDDSMELFTDTRAEAPRSNEKS